MPGRDLAQARRLERGLVGLRWLAVGFGVLQTALTLRLRPEAPDYIVPISFLLVALLAIGNVAVSSLTDRARRVEQLRPIGLSAFVLDIAVILGLVWTSTSPEDVTWVVTYVLSLEGALRYGLPGALVPVGINLVSEVAREYYLTAQLPQHHAYHPASVAFRVGVHLVVAVVAGLMARSLEREAEKARERAALAVRAARVAEAAAEREAEARRELAAFHAAILAGMAADDVDDGLRSIAAAVAGNLGSESLAILLVEDDELVAKGVHGDPGYTAGARFGAGEDTVGRAAATGRPVQGWEPAEVAVPLSVGGELIGVLHERGRATPGAGSARPELLERLAAQIALVAQAARLRARQQETLRRLRELDEMKSDFVAITSHELRTPLAAVRGFVNTLRRRLGELSPREVEEFLGILDHQTERLIRLVEDLLVVSRIEAGEIALRPEPVPLAPFLQSLVRGLEGGPERVRLEAGEGLPEAMFVDPHRLGQVLTNLLQNAIKFSPVDRPVVLEASAEGAVVRFTVADEGQGIPPEERSQIFERFRQGVGADGRAGEGVGLGLYIAKQLVLAMGGEIDVESAVADGSTFTVRLPADPLREARARRSSAARGG